MVDLVLGGDSRPFGWQGTVLYSLERKYFQPGVIVGCVVEES